MQTRAFVAGIFFLSAVAVAPDARAFDAEAQVSESELIVTGRVISVLPERDETTGETWNRAEIDIHEIWKGFPTEEEVAVRTPAGALANPGLALEGSARFQRGENVLLFLTRVGDSYRPWRTVFGKYPIRGSGADARLVGNLPLVAADLGDPTSVALEELRRGVDVIVARETKPDRLDLALGSRRQ